MATVSTLLTWRESRVFRFAQHYIEEYGYAPTIREIGDAVDLSSSSSVSYVLSRLELKGYITRLWGRQAMAIEPAHAGKILVNRDDLEAALKLIDWRDAEVSGPVARLAEAAGIL